MSKFITKNKIIGFSVSIVIIVFTLFFITYNKGSEETTIFTNPTSKTSEVESEKVTATKEIKPAPIKSLPSQNTKNITIIAGEEKINLSVPTNTLFYDALMQAKNEGILTVSGKNYPGMGFFVTDIGALHAGDGKDLLYYINNKEATVGVSSYVLKDGDILEWKLE